MAVDDILEKADTILSGAEEIPNYQELEQTMLINFLGRYSTVSRILNPEGFKRFASLETKNASVQFANITSQKKDVAPFIEYGGHPLLASARTPNMRIYKVFKNENNDPVDEVEIPLFLYGTQNVLNRQDRSTEAYFKGLSFDLNDQTAYGASRMVKANLSLGFNSFAALNKQYVAKSKSGSDVLFSYVDLIRRVRKRKVGQPDKTSPSLDPTDYYSYSLRMEISWNIPSSDIVQDGNLQAAAATGAEVNHIVLLLELEDYELDVQQNGLINLSLNYYSYMEREMERKIDYDIFSSGNTANLAQAISDQKEIEQQQTQREASFTLSDVAGDVGTRAAIGEQLTKEQFTERAKTRIAEERKSIEANIKTLKSDLEALRSRDQNEIFEEGIIFDTTVAQQVENIKSDIAGLQEELKTNDERFQRNQAALQQINDYKFSLNKVDLYSKIMNRLLENGTIFFVSIERQDLLMFSPKYQEAIKEASNGEEIKEQDIRESLKKKKAKLAEQLNAVLQAAPGETTTTSVENIINNVTNSEASRSAESKDKIDLNKALAQGLNSVLTETFGLQEVSVYQNVYFMYFGDLVKELISDELFEQLNKNKIGIILGNINYTREIDFYDNLETEPQKTISVNIADIPISIQYFSQFFANEIVNKNFQKMSIFDFIRGIVNQCLIPGMNIPIAGIPVSHPVSMRSKHLQLTNKFPNMYKNLASFEYGRYDIDNEAVGALKSLRKMTSQQTLKLATASQVWNYLYVYGAETKNITGLANNYEKDMEQGVYHFTFGDATNLTRSGNRTDLIKDIKFVKVKKSGQREMMVEKQMQGGAISSNTELWNVFNVEMTMIGNNLLAPGKHFYVNPLVRGFDREGKERSILSELGMGGYYMATDVSNEIGDNGEWVTRVNGAWQSNGIANAANAEGKAITVAEKEAIENGGTAADAVIELDTLILSEGSDPVGLQSIEEHQSSEELEVLELQSLVD